MEHRLRLEHIEQAAKVIDPVFLNTPQFFCESLSEELGLELIVKSEVLNPIRSFKGRGADYFFIRNPDLAEVVCASAGNFGQGMAYAARKRGIRQIVFASEKASPLKLERMQKLGAQVRLYGPDFDAAKAYARHYAQENKMCFVEDGKEVEISEGAGTIAVELMKYPQSLEVLLIPLGNGALMAGMSRWIKYLSPKTQVIGVVAIGAPTMEKSWRAGQCIQTNTINTIADGIGVRVPVPEALEDLKGLVDDIVLVDDTAIIQAMKLSHQHLGVVLEPSGAVGIAALMTCKGRFSGQRVATILCGGNLTQEQMKMWL
jgi:threonine dehydratase